MIGFFHFYHFLSLFLAELLSKLDWEVEICYVYWVRVLNAPFASFNFFESKFSYASIWGEGDLRGQKRKIYLFLSQLIENQELYIVSQNQLSKSVRKEDMRISTFLALKKCCSSPISPLNLARKLKLGMYMYYEP